MITAEPSLVTVRPGESDSRTLPFGSNSMQHGTAVFEGIRCYSTSDGPALFRLDEHLLRLLNSAQLMGIPHQYELEDLRGHLLDAAARTGLQDCYLRPVIFSAEPYLSVNLSALSFELGVEVWPVPPLSAGHGSSMRVTVSSWSRLSSRSFPSGAKATGIYAVSAVARTDAVRAGFDDAIQLDPDSGRVSEATAANVFGVRNGQLFTPWLQDGPLPGITRATVLSLADELAIPAVEGPTEIDDLFAADELFCTGTASELIHIAAIGERDLARSSPVFGEILAAFQDAVRGRGYGHYAWLTPVPVAKRRTTALAAARAQPIFSAPAHGRQRAA